MEKEVTFKIDVPEGKEAVLVNNQIAFRDIVEYPKTWGEFCKFNLTKDNYYISNNSQIKSACSYARSQDMDKNLLPSLRAAEQHLALMQLHQLRDYYRQGWTPDWFNENETKYAIDHYYNSHTKKQVYSVCTPEIAAYFLSFQSEEIAKEFLKNFKDLIEKAGDLI